MIKLVSTLPEDWGTDEERDGDAPGALAYTYLTARPGGVLEIHALHLTADGEEEVVTDIASIAGWMGWDPEHFEELARAHLEAEAEEAAAFAYADATYDRPRGW